MGPPPQSPGAGQTLRGLLVAVRPLYIGGGLMPFVLGAVLAGGPRDTFALGAGALVVLLVHTVTHYVNDAEDVATDQLSEATAFTGGSQAIQRGLVTPALLLRASAVLALGVVLVAVVALARGDRVSAALYLAILAGGYAYSGRPFMLGRRVLGELDTALVMGVLVTLAGAQAGGGISTRAWALAGVLFAETLLARLCTAYPDLDADRETSKWTIPAVLGARGSAMAFVAVAAAIAGAGIALGPMLPAPGWQTARALGAAAGALVCAALVVTGVARRKPVALPLVGIGVFGASQAVLLAGMCLRLAPGVSFDADWIVLRKRAMRKEREWVRIGTSYRW